MTDVRIFLSSVSAEFRSYRDALRHYLARPNVTAKVQEDFIATGSETLDMLDDYIRQCDAVIHLVGDMTGAMALAPSVAVIRERYPDIGNRLPVASFLEPGGPPLSYTQWEAWLALYHGKRLLIAVPQSGAKRDDPYVLDPLQVAAQRAHLARLESVERHPGIRFLSADQFAAEVWRSSLLDILIEAGLVRKRVHLTYASLGDLFIGREDLIGELAGQFGALPPYQDQAAIAKALTGLGGIGKTRLATEYAWRYAGDYSAILVVGADSAEALERNLAALCAASILDLPEQSETDQRKQRDAVVAWLKQHAGWLLIADNVDTEPAAIAVEALLPQLTGGHVLITSRLANWSAGVGALPVDLLAPASAADFLLLRTEGKRRPQADDPAMARTLAEELGCLALALEQAGAYIAQRRTTFGQYLTKWQSYRDEVLQWFDPRLMQYPTSVAITWQTSFNQLNQSARALLQRLAWLAPDPIPESLLDVPVPGENTAEADPYGALAELASYSLITRAPEFPLFSVHRLVQEVARQGQRDDTAHARLVKALNWVSAAFVGDSQDVRSWETLDPLAAHAIAVATYADGAEIAGPCARLLNDVGALLHQKALYAKAEPLLRRALAIDEASFGANHTDVARDLNNLASLLQDTNRLDEAESMMRRALRIDEARLGVDHARVAIDLNNLGQLLYAMNRLSEAEPLMRRALRIGEARLGAEQPRVAIYLNNLAGLLKATNRLGEAEPLMCRALAIDEASFGADHPDVAIRLNNLARLLQDTNRLDEAEPLMCRALGIDEVSFGTDHPNVARDLNNLATLLHDSNRLGEAEPLMRRAFLILINGLGLGHPLSQNVRRNYFGLLQAMGKTDDEIRAYFASLIT